MIDTDVDIDVICFFSKLLLSFLPQVVTATFIFKLVEYLHLRLIRTTLIDSALLQGRDVDPLHLGFRSLASTSLNAIQYSCSIDARYAPQAH